MTLLNLVQICGFIFGAGLGIKLYVWFTGLQGRVQDERIVKQKEEIDLLMGRATESKQASDDARKDWNDFVNRPRPTDE